MLNIRLTWECDVLSEFFNVYRSEESMNPLQLPIPVAINLTDKSFVDSNISADIVYFYRIKAFYNDKEYISDEILASVTSQNIFIINENESYTPPSGLSVNFTMSD